MTPYQSCRSKQHHKFLHHVRATRKEIQNFSASSPGIAMEGPCLDCRTKNGDQKSPQVWRLNPMTSDKIYREIQHLHGILSMVSAMQSCLQVPSDISDDDHMALMAIDFQIGDYSASIKDRLIHLNKELNQRLEARLPS